MGDGQRVRFGWKADAGRTQLARIQDGMGDAATAHIKRALIQYLDHNPGAGDTLRGIRDWWLKNLRCSPRQILKALHELEREGLIRRAQIADTELWVGAGVSLDDGTHGRRKK